MSEISLKCEVTGCSFFTPRLFPRFYGEMVEHLKVLHFPNPLLLRIFHQVHHLSCHGDSEKRCGPANPTAAACSQPREGKVKIADGEEAKKILDLNMNTKSADNIFVCPEPGLDHNDPSKPSHRLTNGPEPSKTIESDGSNIKKPS